MRERSFAACAYRRFLGEALGVLCQGGIDFVVGKGVTVGETIHADPVLRHCHDVDLLVQTAHLPAAANALYRAGFLPANPGPHDEPRFDHASGLPVELHDRLYRTPFYDGSLNDVWNRARTAVVLAASVHLISDVDLLVQAPVHASLVPQRYNLSWIIDVVHLLRQRESEAATIDWRLVKRIAGDTDAELPLYVTYQYLAATFHVPIPQDVIDELRRSAAKAGRLQHLVALDGLRAEPQTRFKLLLQASGWPSRRAIAVAMLLPPMEYLKGKHPNEGVGALALRYLTRPLWFAGRQLAKARHRFRQRWLNSGPTEPQRAFLARLLPEERLLLGCIRRELSNDAAQGIADDLHDKQIKWMIVLETAKRHGIEPLLWSNLKKCREQGLAVPADVLKCLRVAMFSAIETKERQRAAASRCSGVHESASPRHHADQRGCAGRGGV